jgi:histidinol-phosphatase (PHP family)
VSLHGGHSGEFCEHASGTLRETIDAAVAAELRAYGVTEHAPRADSRFLYDSERAKGYDAERLRREFEAYSRESLRLQRQWRSSLEIVRGFETEAVPSSSYVESMLALRREYRFDYIVGSVHHVCDISIDESPQHFREAVTACNGLESFMERYYRMVEEMIRGLRPEIVAHLDLPKLHAPRGADLRTPKIRRAAEAAIEAAKSHNCILDLNTAGWRKGLSDPFPSPWLVRLAAEAGAQFCFGDDSHSASQVGYGLKRARQYLLDQGVDSITALGVGRSGLERRQIPLAP